MSDSMADKLAIDNTVKTYYDKSPKCVISSELTEDSIAKWDTKWINTNNGKVIKSFFLCVNRLKTKLPVTSNFTAMLTGYGKTKAYLR